MIVCGKYFQTLGIHPFAGRMFTFADDVKGSMPVAVMSYQTWQQHYGGDPSVLRVLCRRGARPPSNRWKRYEQIKGGMEICLNLGGE